MQTLCSLTVQTESWNTTNKHRENQGKTDMGNQKEKEGKKFHDTVPLMIPQRLTPRCQ